MTTKQRQNLLQYLGYYSGDIDGIYGQQTKAAVERFQEAFGGIVVDGVAGAEWTRSDGVVFTGEMIAPWKDCLELDAAQRSYERQQLAEYAEALKIMGVIV